MTDEYDNTGKRLQKIANNPVSDEEERYSIVLKIVYGSDKMDNLFVYVKLKNFKSENDENKFLDKSYILMYQNPRGKYADDINKRQLDIIESIKEMFTISDEREFGDKKSFFIKGKLFRELEKIDKFYVNLVMRIVIKFGEDNFQSGIKIIDEQEMIEWPAILNFFKKVLFKIDEKTNEEQNEKQKEEKTETTGNSEKD